MRYGVALTGVLLSAMAYAGCTVLSSAPSPTDIASSPLPVRSAPVRISTPAATQMTLVVTCTSQPAKAALNLPSLTALPTSTAPATPSQTSTTTPSRTISPTPSPTATSTATVLPPRVRSVSLTLPTFQYTGSLHDTSPTDPIYPYRRLDLLEVGPLQAQSYQALVLENAYVALTIVPELGGRVLRWWDKTTGETPFYANPVLKPTHWGYRGWWFATGGMEWAFPTEEHGLVDWEPWDYRIVRDAAQTTVVVADRDELTGLELEIGIGLKTDASAVYITPSIRNPLPQARSYEFWINAMIALSNNRASDRLEFVLPSQQVTVHSTGQTDLPSPGQPLSWPIYQGQDLSSYGSWQTYLGVFAYPLAQANFMGAYDHTTEFGIVRSFPASIARGAKIFGGKDLDPFIWTTDGSTYVELWGGVMPRFGEASTLNPGDVLTWTEVWYTVSGLGGFVYANDQAALEMEIQPDMVTVGAAANRDFVGVLRLQKDGRAVAHWPVTLHPGEAAACTWPRVDIAGSQWNVQLLDSSNLIVAERSLVAE
jgi:hypothetical protein